MTEASIVGGVQFTIIRAHGQIVEIQTDSPEVNHFLQVLKLSRAYNTWLSYALDLKAFFAVVRRPLASIGRPECLSFVEQQDRQGHARTTVNRRLAALSSLFTELQLLDPVRFPHNPVSPLRYQHSTRRRSQSLYRKQPERLLDIIPADALRTFFATLPTWRDRTLMLLMWLSCLRISEAVAIHFEHIECSRRSIYLPVCKGNHPRTVYMDQLTFAALNRYLDEERQDRFPDQPAVFVALKGRARGQPLSVNALQKLIAYHAAACKLPDLHAHRLRHTGITQLIQQGMTEPAVRDFVGHHHPASLLPYLHLADSYVETEFRRAQQALEITQLLKTSEPADRGGAL
jgi:site-specific recombinase XerD